MPLRKIYLELTNRCNLNCAICYRQSWNEEHVDLSPELYRKISNEIKQSTTIDSIVLGGIGEPTCSNLIETVIKDHSNLHLTLTTNGITLSDSLKEHIINGINILIISIDGLYDNFAKIRGTNLEGIVENIRQLNQLKKEYNHKDNSLTIGIQFVMSKDNISDLFELIDLASDLQVNRLILSNLLPQTQENASKILYQKYNNHEMRQLINKASNYALRKGITLTIPNYELKTERRCDFIENNSMVITASGDVTPCYRLSHSYQEYVFGRKKRVDKYSFGNLKQQSLKEIWENSNYVNFRNTVFSNRYPSCIDCDYVDGCDLVNDTTTDCYAGTPSCADCLWARKFTLCP